VCVCNDTINRDEVSEAESFKYSWLFKQKNRKVEEEVKHRTKCGWIKLREVSGVLCYMVQSVGQWTRK